MNRKQALAKIWRDTHKDFKGKLASGDKSIMMLVNGGSALVLLDTLSDIQIKQRVPEYEYKD